MSWSRIKHSNKVKFLLVHLAVCVIAAGMIMKNHEAGQGMVAYKHYFLVFVETYLASLGGAFLSLGLFIQSFFLGFSHAGVIHLFGRELPVTIVAGASSLLAFVFALTGANSRGKTSMYVAFVISSMLFIYGSYLFFLNAANTTEHLLRF